MKSDYLNPDSFVLRMDCAPAICATSDNDASTQDYYMDDEGNFFNGQ